MGPKILFTASTYSHMVHFHLPYFREFARRGWEVDAACGGEPMELPGVRRVIHLPLRKSIAAPENLRAQKILRRELMAEGYDLVSAHTSLAGFFTRRAAVGLDTKVVYTCHGYLFDGDTDSAKRALLLGAERLTASRTDLLLTMNRQDRQIAEAHRLGRRVVSIPGMGVDFAPLDAVAPEEGAALRRKLELPEGAFVLLYPAEFSARKSQETLIRAMTMLPRTVYLLLPGSGATLETCRALAGKLGVAQRIRFPGYVDDMAPWYRCADCAVSSSRIEGLPFNVMEAMYAGLPVVASAIKGHEDLVQEGRTGLLFPYGEAEACAGKIVSLVGAPARLAGMGGEARAAAEQYRLDRVLPQVMAAYAPLLGEKQTH